MVYRKGELSKTTIDREWPYQVALPEEAVQGRNFIIIDRFCRGLSVCPRRQGYRKDDTDYTVFCFSERHDAEFFQMHFDGKLMTPETRPPRWPKAARRTT